MPQTHGPDCEQTTCYVTRRSATFVSLTRKLYPTLRRWEPSLSHKVTCERRMSELWSHVRATTEPALSHRLQKRIPAHFLQAFFAILHTSLSSILLHCWYKYIIAYTNLVSTQTASIFLPFFLCFLPSFLPSFRTLQRPTYEIQVTGADNFIK